MRTAEQICEAFGLNCTIMVERAIEKAQQEVAEDAAALVAKHAARLGMDSYAAALLERTVRGLAEREQE